MIQVKLYGLLRVESGIREMELEGSSVRQMKQQLLARTDRITRKELDGCIVLVNGRPGNGRTKLKDGDEVQLLSPVAGG